MKEIEVKILETSHADLEPRILELGGKKVFDETVETYFFDKDSFFVENKQHLRLRTIGKQAFITHKHKILNENVKEAEETEIKVSDFAEAKKLLEALGYQVYRSYSKRRVQYKLGNVILDFDKPLGRYAAVPEFLEIEAPSEQEVFATADSLGVARDACLNWSGKKVLQHYGLER
jgi:adenylate cyclase class 2